MPLYETVFIARQDVSAPQVEVLTKTFADLVTEQGGQVKKTEQWGLRNLAYRINKNKKGHYVMFNIDALPAAIAEMERNMGLNEDILRFMTVRVEAHETEASAILRKEERSDRPSFGADRAPRGDDRPRRAPRSEHSEGEAA